MLLFLLFFGSEIAFDLDFPTRTSGCDSIDSFHEGVELSFRSTIEDEDMAGQEWIPLMYITGSSNLDDDTISLVKSDTLTDKRRGNFMLRGYSVPYVIASSGKHQYRVTLCKEDASFLEYPMVFRWLQTSSMMNRSITEDIVMLDDISISLQNSSHYASLFEQSFDDQNSLTNE